MAGRGVRRALILLPAGLLKQWQTELREKGGMIFPRLEGTTTLVWPDERTEKVSGVAEALERDVLLMSRETARTENNLPLLLAATPWDLVVLDESHAARRREQEEGEFNSGTLLLTLLRRLQLRRRVRGFLLLSATPMQTHPWEPWDLLTVLGEGGAWLADFAGVRDFYAAVAAVRNGRCDIGTARKAAALITADPLFPAPSSWSIDTADSAAIAKALAFATSTKRDEIAQWLRQGSPLARRMHRNTRGTLQRYYEMGLLPNRPPQRVVEDIVFDFQDSAEREVYNAVSRYIEKRFAELEKEKPGKGFVMTIYRRRASSSPYALERSLKRRQDGLRRVADHKAYDQELEIGEGLDPRDLDDIGGFEGIVRVSAALPSDPKVALAELNEVDRVLANLHELRGKDSKRDRFFDVLRRITDDGRPVLVFTEYTDTLEYVRDNLVSHYGKGLGCYSGDGGQLWDGDKWYPVTKDTITLALRNGELRALVCTDAASEGLNLQAAGAVINYDLPWNPSKVEQRIGRIDRIGQQLPQIRVINLFLKDSVDDKVYRALRTRCGLFEHFVGSMQPVLAQARRMLLGQDTMDLHVLHTAASQIERDPLASETYIESQAQGDAGAVCPVMRTQIESALGYLTGEFGPQVKSEPAGAKYILSGPAISRTVFASTVPALEHDHAALPLSPLEPRLREMAEGLVRPGERLPLVIGSYQSGAFRSSTAYWVDDGEKVLVESLEDLECRVKAWSGEYPDPESWLQAERAARAAAEEQVRNSERRAAKREREGLERQTAAARLRLQRELGRYLACLEAGTADLNGLLHKQMSRDISSAQRLKKCLEKLGGYPDWNSNLCQELQIYADQLTDNQRRARLLGTVLDAALDDPRWLADSKGD
jgi:superfamily II DNA or RNA helicase